MQSGIECVKTAADVYAPVSGSILEVNTKAKNEPGLLNQSAETEGWILKIKVTDDNDLSNHFAC